MKPSVHVVIVQPKKATEYFIYQFKSVANAENRFLSLIRAASLKSSLLTVYFTGDIATFTLGIKQITIKLCV